MRTCQIPAAFVAGVAFSVACVAPAAAGTIVDLGTLGGSYSYAYGINASGQVVGGSETAAGVEDAFLYSNGSMIDLGTPYAPDSYARGINDAGQVVGGPAGTVGSAFLYLGGTMSEITGPGFTPGGPAAGASINASGEIALTASTIVTPRQAFVYIGGVLTPIPSLGGSLNFAEGINNAGNVVGTAYVTDAGGGIEHAYLYSGGMTHDLGTLGGAQSIALSINSGGQIVGISETTGENSNSSYAGAHAVLYEGGSMVDLGTLGGSFSEAFGINDAGLIVGESYTTGDTAQHAFLDSGGSMIDLNSLLPAGSGWELEAATAINGSGEIVGYGINPNGQTDAFLLNTEVPEPNSLSLLGVSVLLLKLARKRLRHL